MNRKWISNGNLSSGSALESINKRIRMIKTGPGNQIAELEYGTQNEKASLV